MRVLAVFLVVSAGTVAKAPCQKKNPMTKGGKVHNTNVFQENFIN